MVVLLLVSPMAVGTRAPAPLAVELFEPTDAELMLQLARLDRPTLVPLARVTVPTDATLDDVLLRVSARANAPLGPSEAAEFASLDASLREPLILLFLTIERTWDAYDAATRRLSDDELQELAQLHEAGEIDSPRGVRLLSQVDHELLLAAAITLVDTIESTILPQLEAAAQTASWPPNGLADPAGVLRLGSPQDDMEDLDRIVQIDPRGDDTYTNNAGASTILDPLLEGETDWNILTPIAISIDLNGNDTYDSERGGASQGSSVLGLGFGLLLDLQGDDSYTCAGECLSESLGIVRDYEGNDDYRPTRDFALGDGTPLAIFRDDAGDDRYFLPGFSSGYSHLPGMLGLFWDRGGADVYEVWLFADRRLGWGDQGGRGWFVDEGPEADVYETASTPFAFDNHGCNDCTWQMGTGLAGEPSGGQGNDNRGGVSHLLLKQDPLLRTVPS